jgi:hypothetical protein
VDVKANLRVVHFDTENKNDKLTVKGIDYDGNGVKEGPQGVTVTPGDILMWNSDATKTLSGFKICMDEIVPTPAPNYYYTEFNNRAGVPRGVPGADLGCANWRDQVPSKPFFVTSKQVFCKTILLLYV